MEDRLYRGFVAGVVGGVVAIALSHLSYFLGFTTLRLSDWAAKCEPPVCSLLSLHQAIVREEIAV